MDPDLQQAGVAVSLPDLALLLRSEGVRVREAPGWRSNVRPGGFAPVGNLVHHTADKGVGDSGLEVLRRGRSDLLGPLCNGSPREDGELVLLSAGRANHAGMGSGVVLDRVRRDLAPTGTARSLGLRDTVVGNGLFYGWEVDNDGLGQPYPPAQVETTVRVCAATSRAHGWSPKRTILHAEWTRRKSDWSHCAGDELRELVADRLRADEQEEQVALTEQDVERIAQRTRQVIADGQQPYGLDNLRRMLVTLIDLVARTSAGDRVTTAELMAAVDGLPEELLEVLKDRIPVNA